MAITVESALKLPEMDNITVVAGNLGLRREISAVNLMETPDISKYLNRGELLITTYPIQNGEELQRRLIPILSEIGVAALALAPVYSDSRIPRFMINQANELSFPVLKIPYGTALNGIMDSVLHCIIKQHYSSELIEDILQGKITSITQAQTVGHMYNWDLEGAFIPAIAHGEIAVALPPDVITVELESDTLLIFPISDCENEEKRMNEIIQLFNNRPGISLGIGRAIENIIELPKGYAQAQQALKVAMDVKGKNIACYE